MRFTLTESESKLLKALKTSPATKTELAAVCETEAQLARAIEGCKIKGFLRENDGTLFLTKSGEECV